LIRKNHFKIVTSFSNSATVKFSLYSSFTCHKPLSLIFSFVDLFPNQLYEGLISPDLTALESVEVILLSQNRRLSLVSTSKTKNERFF
jgi:hypothetical protein